MASRVGLAGLLVVAACLLGAGRAEPSGTTPIYTVRVDPRLCPSPRCGGYFVAVANVARTRCVDGLRRPRCYVAVAVATNGVSLARIPDGSLARGTVSAGRDDLGELRVSAVHQPAGSGVASSGFFRVRDTGLRCVRAPCFSYTAVRINRAAHSRVSGVDLAAAGATPGELASARAMLSTTAGLYVSGRIARGGDGGRVLRATRIYVRAPLPRA